MGYQAEFSVCWSSVENEQLKKEKDVPSYQKHQVNWNTVCGAMRDLPCHNIWSSDNPMEVLNEHLSLLVARYVPTKIIHVCNKDKPWFDGSDVLLTSSRRLIFSGPMTALGLIGNSVFAVKSELMKHTQRASISLVSETSMFS